MSITKTEALETLEEIYEFFNVGYEKGFIGSDDPDVKHRHDEEMQSASAVI